MPSPQVSVDLQHQTQGVLPVRRGGTGAQAGLGDVFDVEPNVAGAVIPLGSLVRLETAYVVEGVIPCTTDFDPYCVGAVQGEFVPSTGEVIYHDVPDPGIAYILRRGRGVILAGATVSRLDYLAASATSGRAQPIPAPAGGVVAQARSGGSDGDLVGAILDVPSLATSGNSSGFLSVVTLEAGDFLNDVATGLGTYKGVPFAHTVVGTISEADSGATGEFDVLRANASVPLSAGTGSICGGDYPALTAETWAYQAATVNWDTAGLAQDVYRLEVRSIDAGRKRVTLQLVIRQT